MSVPTFIDETPEKVFVYWSCPVRFVPSSITEFVGQYNYYKNFPSALQVKYDEMSPRFRTAMLSYESQLVAYKMLLLEKGA